MRIVTIDEESSKRLEELSVQKDKSKGSIALEICEFFFGQGVPHPKINSSISKSSAA